MSEARPTAAQRGLPHAGDARIAPFAALADQFLVDHRERLMSEAATMNLAVREQDVAFARQAVRNARVVTFAEGKAIDPGAKRSDKAFYDRGTIYLYREFVDRWIRGGEGVRIWEELIHESKHALIESALGATPHSESQDHMLFEWLYPYYIVE